MSLITNINIVIHVNEANYEELKTYYRNLFLFDEEKGLFLLPMRHLSVGLLIMTPSVEQGELSCEKKPLPCFSFEISKNFLSYCLDLYKKGILFDMACRHPGGYYARIFDPAGNQFEVWCNSDEDDYLVDTTVLPFYYSY